MSLYQVQKAIFHLMTDAVRRELYRRDRAAFLDGYELSGDERAALAAVDIAGLYRMGVDPLLLRPFTQINGVAAKDHYAALAGLE